MAKSHLSPVCYKSCPNPAGVFQMLRACRWVLVRDDKDGFRNLFDRRLCYLNIVLSALV